MPKTKLAARKKINHPEVRKLFEDEGEFATIEIKEEDVDELNRLVREAKSATGLYMDLDKIHDKFDIPNTQIARGQRLTALSEQLFAQHKKPVTNNEIISQIKIPSARNLFRNDGPLKHVELHNDANGNSVANLINNMLKPDSTPESIKTALEAIKSDFISFKNINKDENTILDEMATALYNEVESQKEAQFDMIQANATGIPELISILVENKEAIKQKLLEIDNPEALIDQAKKAQNKFTMAGFLQPLGIPLADDAASNKIFNGIQYKRVMDGKDNLAPISRAVSQMLKNKMGELTTRTEIDTFATSDFYTFLDNGRALEKRADDLLAALQEAETYYTEKNNTDKVTSVNRLIDRIGEVKDQGLTAATLDAIDASYAVDAADFISTAIIPPHDLPPVYIRPGQDQSNANPNPELVLGNPVLETTPSLLDDQIMLAKAVHGMNQLLMGKEGYSQLTIEEQNRLTFLLNIPISRSTSSLLKDKSHALDIALGSDDPAQVSKAFADLKNHVAKLESYSAQFVGEQGKGKKSQLYARGLESIAPNVDKMILRAYETLGSRTQIQNKNVNLDECQQALDRINMIIGELALKKPLNFQDKIDLMQLQTAKLDSVIVELQVDYTNKIRVRPEVEIHTLAGNTGQEKLLDAIAKTTPAQIPVANTNTAVLEERAAAVHEITANTLMTNATTTYALQGAKLRDYKAANNIPANNTAPVEIQIKAGTCSIEGNHTTIVNLTGAANYATEEQMFNEAYKALQLHMKTRDPNSYGKELKLQPGAPLEFRKALIAAHELCIGNIPRATGIESGVADNAYLQRMENYIRQPSTKMNLGGHPDVTLSKREQQEKLQAATPVVSSKKPGKK